MNETRTTEHSGPEADDARGREVEKELATVKEQILALAGDHTDEVRRLVGKYDDLKNEACDLRVHRYFRQLAEFTLHYGVPGLWKALYLRFGCDIFVGGWALGEFYREGDEWRFVFGKGWREWVKSAKHTATADAA